MKRCAFNASTCEDGDGVLGYETGWKDAAIAYPYVDDDGEPWLNEEDEPIGFNTTVRMKFDIQGVYGKYPALIAVITIFFYSLQL